MATTTDGQLVEAARAGDQQAFGKLFDTWFDRVHDLSRRIVRDPGIAGEVAQDAFLAAWTRLATLEDPDAFGGWLLRIARNGSLNRLAKERRSVALDDETMTTITDLDATDPDPLARMDQAARIDLVWDAAAALGERDLSILDLHLRHGLGAAELAEELGTTANNAHQILFTLRKRLGTNVRALVLWRGGRPACDDLRRTLTTAKVKGFDKAAVKVIDKHAQACDTCSREREDRLSPAALFGAAPVVAAPFLFKAQAASALEAAGVPMGGSSALAGAAGPGTGAGTGAGPAGGSSAGAGAGPAPVGAAGAGGAVGAGAGAGTDPTLPEDGGLDGDRRRRTARVLALVALVVALLVAGGFALADRTDDPDEVATAGSTSVAPPGTAPGKDTSSSPSTSPGGPATTATTAPGGFDVTPGDDPEPTVGPTDVGPTVPGTPATTVPATTRPGTTAPPTRPPTTAPPTTAPPTTRPTTTTSTTAPLPTPAIDRFVAGYGGTQCKGGYLWGLAWATTDADRVEVAWSQGAPVAGTPDGKTSLCIPARPGSRPQFTLTAYGPGGTASTIVAGT